MTTQSQGYWLGMAGMITFGLTLPMTRIALESFDPLFITFGRSALAGLIAAAILLLTKSKFPSKPQRWNILIVACGVVLGFPILTALAMQTVPSSHGGVVLGILPLMTACAATFISQERPSVWFWLVGVLGAAVVILYALNQGAGHLSLGDGLLFGAVIAAALGYAVGGQLAKDMSGWRVICWSLVMSLPFTIVMALLNLPTEANALGIRIEGVVAFAYLALMSQLFGFFLWYKGLALGGIARVSQTQLLQPFVTFLAAVALAKEQLDVASIVFASLVVAIVWLSRKVRIYTQHDPKI